MHCSHTHDLTKILPAWGIPQSFPLRTDIPIAGSPERCHVRHLLQVEDDLYLLEAVHLSKHLLREQQTLLLHALQTNGMEGISPWLLTTTGDCGVLHDNLFWQLRRFLAETAPLPRETYGFVGWRGTELAQTLLSLQKASAKLPSFLLPKPFSLAQYIHQRLLPEIAEKNPALHRDVQPILDELQPFLQREPELPQGFCHGDFHPGNILWKPTGIAGVIDWEFCGPKIQTYDAANLLGCIGMDEPEWLTSALAENFLTPILEARAFSEEALAYLPETMAALRFGWLREWFIRDDRELLCQELDFIYLLLDNRDLLREKWNLPA